MDKVHTFFAQLGQPRRNEQAVADALVLLIDLQIDWMHHEAAAEYAEGLFGNLRFESTAVMARIKETAWPGVLHVELCPLGGANWVPVLAIWSVEAHEGPTLNPRHSWL